MVDIKGLLSNPMAALQSSRQPGGLLAPVTSFREAVTDPRLFIADALINRTPITTALTNYAAINQSLTPEKEETFTLLSEIEKSNAGLDPTRTYQKSDISGKITQVGTSPTVTIEGDKPGQTKEEEIIGEYYGETFTNIAKRGDEAFKANQDIQIMEQLLENTDFETGSFGEFRTSAEKIASEFGVNLDVQNVPAAEAYRSLSGKVVLSNLQYTKGAVSDREMNFFGTIAPGLTMSKEGNRLVLDIAKRKNTNEIRYRDAAINWIDENDRLRKKNKDGQTWGQFTLEFQKNNPLYLPEEEEMMKNLAGQRDPQFAGNDIIENNGIEYIEIGGDFYKLWQK